MKPLNYFEQIVRMPNKADKYDLRLRMMKHALTYGVKPIARVFVTTAKTVRKWLNRYRQERPAGLGPSLCLRRQGPPTSITRQRLG